ncbi:MAG: hypothetical protein JJE51_05940, partial [Thermoanaerobaculia bacterium]|nr:hypothetical protein [Thermoanaerobaculia bacterium]
KEGEQKALADQALADFAAKEGIAIEPATESSSTTTETTRANVLGPTTTTE